MTTLLFNPDASGPDTTRRNLRSMLYVTTDPTANNESDAFSDNAIDGSIRIVFTPGETFAHIESKASGVWNDTGFRTSSASIEIGRDMKIEASADFIKTVNPSGFDIHSVALIPHIPFDDTGTGFPHTPITDAIADNIIFSTAISEVSGTILSQAFTITSAQIINTMAYEVGSVGATDKVTHTIYSGTDNTGDILSLMRLPASDFIAGATTTIDFDATFGFSDVHSDIFVELTTDTAFTLKTDVSGNILIAITSQQLETRDLLYDDLIVTQDLSLLFTRSMGLVYHKQFRN